ncbi:hypothetical protein [Winogradskyella sp.]|jgi:hypothetical protein|uniref:hypothetical protein n=1 Tax=Winogradskyella sp. TaxID=1883156 RepID=UPI0025E5F127|nr:hypothetical protein [Winogradskyella sp.]MCT4630699.1 hypothetical protein [Winogradskyella sp.]
MGASSMILSIRNNLNLLSNRKKLKNRLGGYYSESKQEYNLPKASKTELNALAQRLQKEYKIRMTKVIIITILLFLGLVYAFTYSSNGIIELLSC